MPEIKIISEQALRFAQAATSPKDKVPVFRHIRVLPDGAISGTNGYTLAHHPAAAEPFEGEPLYIIPQRTIPTNAKDIVLDIERGQMRYKQGNKHNVMLLDIGHDVGAYPMLFPILDHWPVSVDATEMIVNGKYLAAYAKASSDKHGHLHLRFVSNRSHGVMVAISGHPEQVVLLPVIRGSNVSVSSRLVEAA